MIHQINATVPSVAAAIVVTVDTVANAAPTIFARSQVGFADIVPAVFFQVAVVGACHQARNQRRPTQ